MNRCLYIIQCNETGNSKCYGKCNYSTMGSTSVEYVLFSYYHYHIYMKNITSITLNICVSVEIS